MESVAAREQTRATAPGTQEIGSERKVASQPRVIVFDSWESAKMAGKRGESSPPGNLNGAKYPWRTFWRRSAI
jgi:hypothetical protein